MCANMSGLSMKTDVVRLFNINIMHNDKKSMRYYNENISIICAPYAFRNEHVSLIKEIRDS